MGGEECENSYKVEINDAGNDDDDDDDVSEDDNEI